MMTPTREADQPIRIGTRGSTLARWQADRVERDLQRVCPGQEFAQVVIRTTGDIKQSQPLAQFAGFGVFTRELDTALLDGRIDLAVHSAKDYPTEVHCDLTIAAFPCRDGANDSLVARNGAGLGDLRDGALIGTGSLRRSAQLANLRPDLRFAQIRGNVETRLKKVDSGEYDATMMAEAALRRLQISRPREVFPIDQMVPAAGMGALMVVCRHGDDKIIEMLQRIDNDQVSRCVTAERAALLGLGGGCRLPIGVHAAVRDDTFRIQAVVLSRDGKQKAGAVVAGPMKNSADVAERAVQQVLDRGGWEIIEQMNSEESQ